MLLNYYKLYYSSIDDLKFQCKYHFSEKNLINAKMIVVFLNKLYAVKLLLEHTVCNLTVMPKAINFDKLFITHYIFPISPCVFVLVCNIYVLHFISKTIFYQFLLTCRAESSSNLELVKNLVHI